MRAIKLFLSPWGRIARTGFWLVVGTAFFIVFVPFLTLVVFLARSGGKPEVSDAIAIPVGLSAFIIVPLVVYLFFAASGKRFNDRNKSAWWLFLWFVPVVGPLWTFVELGFLAGSPGPNRFGPSPRAELSAFGDVTAVFDQQTFTLAKPAGRTANVVALLLAWVLVAGGFLGWLYHLGTT